ncbi:DAD family-domain-containing protein [Irpex rosettiformis]|uniref:DAD family-domain-containing protein n=1 Tax=Irpex rosettiformis TaxID=378272 RepID=A0ACB8UFU4_9APHY|nr:DAD family-domain-containing protein [Irpex rosettiformis]
MPASKTPSTSQKSSAAVASTTTKQTQQQVTGTTNAIQTLFKAYNETTSSRLKLVDAFLVFLMLSGISQFLYCILVTNFPFNAFLAGFGSNVGQFVLTASLRAQVNPENRTVFKDVSPERAFADFVLGSIVLHFFVYNFLG